MKDYLPTDYQRYIHLSRYSRFIPDLKRRETWTETVDRYINFFKEHLATNTTYDVESNEDDFERVRDAILNLRVMPSMRCLMTAGEALKRENIAGYNCSYVAINRPAAFDEILYILMNGTGVGFSVERQHVSQLPVIAEQFHKTDTVIHVADSKLGWAKAFKELIGLLYAGQIPNWDISKVRKAGSILKTFGGRASGPEPLVELFNFTITMFKNAAGRKLSSIECHDLVCKTAKVVVVGGVRRSALISLSNLSDDRMRTAKTGNWYAETESPHRNIANNSAAYTEKPDIGIFMNEWISLYQSKSGERGLFNRDGIQRLLEKNVPRRDRAFEFGTNPCSEIILRDRQFCNLSEVVIRADDTIETLKDKVEIATIIGTWQSTLTNFRYISKKWAENCEEERLLGVSMTGIMDNTLTNGKIEGLDGRLQALKSIAYQTNVAWAAKLGINPSAAITCVKPSGNVSQLVNASSGIHARWSPFYIRTARQDMKDPLAMLMVDEFGFPAEPDITAKETTYVLSFPIKSPTDSVFRNDLTAIEQLELWLTYQDNWCEHKPSVTIYVKEPEWLEVGAWVYKHFDYMSGVSFLPHSDHIYKQAPYTECTEEEYDAFLEKMPKNVDWARLSNFESTDMTTATNELACQAGNCEL